MLVSILDWIIYFSRILQVRILKSSLFSQASIGWSWVWQGLYDDGPSGLQNTWTLPRLHGLDNYSLGMNLNWHGHKIRLGQNQLLNQPWTLFQASKIIFIFPHFTHMLVLYPWIVFRAKKQLICELFSSSLPPSSTQKCCFVGSVASGQQRPSYALLVTDTQWGGATLLTAQMRMFHASRKLYSVDIFIWISMLFYFCYARKNNLLVMTNWFEH